MLWRPYAWSWRWPGSKARSPASDQALDLGLQDADGEMRILHRLGRLRRCARVGLHGRLRAVTRLLELDHRVPGISVAVGLPVRLVGLAVELTDDGDQDHGRSRVRFRGT